MKRFFSFLLFVCLLLVAVTALRLWKQFDANGYPLRDGWRSLFTPRDPQHHSPEKYTVAEGPRINVADVNVLAAMSRQRILLARAVVPSVVSITTLKAAPAPAFNGDPLLQFFHRGLRPGASAPQKVLGSGAIVSKEGHIVTNTHVIDQMEEIEVRLSDGRLRPAILIGSDPDTDIAVLKIDATNIQPLPFGDSDGVEVGETVMAVGNPYGLDESVTQGIISAKGRRGSENISDLFQTDAAINPGNSGGPLINVRGELIGINEAIFSESGGWQGVGFAIPAATVRTTMDTILKTGRAIHSYLGIYQLPANEDGLRQRGLGNQKGVLVDTVASGSPADKANIQPGDFIQKFNHHAVNDFQDLRHSVAEVGVDTRVSIELVRNGRTINVSAVIAEKPPRESLAAGPSHLRKDLNPGAPATGASSLEGIQVVDLASVLARSLDLPRDLQGVIVRRVEAGAAAAGKLQPGDVIEQIDQQPVNSVVDFAKLLRALPAGAPVELSVLRGRTRRMVVLGDS